MTIEAPVLGFRAARMSGSSYPAAVRWSRVGSTPAARIHKVVVREARNFPVLAQFYADEVMQPADRLFTSAVQRGVARGEFRDLPVHEVAHALLAPMIFMALHRHSLGACPVQGCVAIDPASALRTHLMLMLNGLERPVASPAPPVAPPRPCKTPACGSAAPGAAPAPPRARRRSPQAGRHLKSAA